MTSIFLYLIIYFSTQNFLYAQEQEPDLITFANSERWNKYLHMDQSEASRIKLDSIFFLSKNGYKNSLDELKESLKTFRNPELFLQKKIGHPQCLFPARFKLLAQHFIIKANAINCPAYDNWSKNTKNKEVQIIFASQFVNNPASVMGHTFLKFKSNDSSDYLNLYLAYAAEVPDNTSPLKYFYNGITGRFNGTFSEGPYYQKVYEYNDIEQRDIWEYALHLDEKQKEYLSDHLWELKNTANFDYYFFDKNCSYMLLEILNTIYDNQYLIPNNTFIIPHETLKQLNNKNLLYNERYLPSIRSNLVYKFNSLSKSEKQDTIKITSTNHFDGNENYKVLDTLIYFNLISFQRNKKKNPSYKDSSFSNQILSSRSKIKELSNEQEAIPYPASPLTAHPPHQISIWLGNQNNGKMFYSLILRPGIHEQMDKSDGFVPNSSFSFLSPELRYKPDQKKLYLNSFKFIDFSSINPYTAIDSQLSWGIMLSSIKNESSECTECSILKSLIFFGYNFRISNSTSYNLFPSLEFQHQFSPRQMNDSLIGGTAEYIYEKGKIKLLLNESIQQPMRSYKTAPTIYSTNFKFRIFNLLNNDDLESKILIKNFSSLFKSYTEFSLGYIFKW